MLLKACQPKNLGYDTVQTEEWCEILSWNCSGLQQLLCGRQFKYILFSIGIKLTSTSGSLENILEVD